MTTACAPVAVYVYRREDKLRRCVESLARNPLAPSTELFVVSDGARSGDAGAQRDIDAIREYVTGIQGFRSVNPMFRPVNWGSTRSISTAERELATEYGSFIGMEDDNEVAPGFLDYMNQALQFYRDDPRIFSISGYKQPFTLPPGMQADAWFSPCHNAWTYASWKDRFAAIDYEDNDYSDIFADPVLRRRLRSYGRFLFDAAWLDWKGYARANDARLCMRMLRAGQVSVLPATSLARNVGHDGSGERAKRTRRFEVELDTSGSRQFDLPTFAGLDPAVVNAYRHFMDKGPMGSLVRDAGVKRAWYVLRAGLRADPRRR